MKATFLPILGVFLIASLDSTAMAGPAMKGTVVEMQPSTGANIQVWQDETSTHGWMPPNADERLFDEIAKDCNNKGGGASSDPDHPGAAVCHDPDGNKID